MKIKDALSLLDSFAPLAFAADFDNTGLLVGDKENDLKGILLCHDALEEVVQEAIDNKCNLIVCYHPIWFKKVSKLRNETYWEKAVITAIKNDISIYAIHTAFDHSLPGMNTLIADKIGLKNVKVLVPQSNNLVKLVTYAPINEADKVRNAMFAAGAGNIGNYTNCSFNSEGFGTYIPNENANPFIGEKGKLQNEPEIKIEVMLHSHQQNKIYNALIQSHPYEEVSYYFIPLNNTDQMHGSGAIGELENELSLEDFLREIKEKFNLESIRYSGNAKHFVKRVAVCGGSGSSFISAAKGANADVYITGDLKYHDFMEFTEKFNLVDIGHFESEQFTHEIIYAFLKRNFANFALRNSKIKSNPVKYFS